MEDSSSLYIPGSIAKEEGEESSSVDKERLGDLRSKEEDDDFFFDNIPSSSFSEGGGEGTEASIPLLPLPSTDGLVAGKNPVEERNAVLEDDPEEEHGFNPPDPRGRGSLLCRNTPLLPPPPPLLIPPPLLLLDST